jgi:hypothetical protein
MVMSLLIALASAVATPPALPPLTREPSSMSQSEIRAYNTGRVRTDPDFIRCVRSEETGSLARKTFMCRTNSQWTLVDRVGNQTARDAYEAMTSKAINQSN